MADITLDPLVFYRLKAAYLEAFFQEAKALQVLALIREKKRRAFQEAGLDPNQDYSLVDEGFRAVPVVNPSNPG